jgi:hypothetical protein
VKALVAMLAFFGVVACASSGQWAWRRHDGSVDPKELAADIDACEAYRETTEAGRGPRNQFSARGYGDWGNSAFEFCMERKKWELEYVKGGASSMNQAEL